MYLVPFLRSTAMNSQQRESYKNLKYLTCTSGSRISWALIVPVSPSKAKGTNVTNRRDATLANRKEVREKGLKILLCLKDTHKGLGDLEDMGRRGGRKVGVLRTVAIMESSEREGGRIRPRRRQSRGKTWK